MSTSEVDGPNKVLGTCLFSTKHGPHPKSDYRTKRNSGVNRQSTPKWVLGASTKYAQGELGPCQPALPVGCAGGMLSLALIISFRNIYFLG